MSAIERRSKLKRNEGREIEQTPAQAALRDSEDRYRRLVELSPEPIAVHQEGRWVFVNQAAAALFGARSPQDLIGRPVFDFIHQDYRPLVLERIRHVLEEGGTAELVEEKFLTVDGQVLDVEVFAMPATFDGRPAYQLMARDITERKRAEAARRQAEERYRNLFENAVFGVFQTTADGRFLNANQALAQMFGYESPDELIEQVTDIGGQIHVDPARRAELVRLLEAEGSVSGFEAAARRRDGRRIEIELTARAVKDADGNVITFEGIVEDITMRKLAEGQLREQKRVLETIEQVGALLASELDLAKTAQAVIDAATELTGAQFAVFAYRDTSDGREYLSRHSMSGGGTAAFEGPAFPHDGSFESIFGDLGVVRSDDIALDHRLAAAAPRLGLPSANAPVRSYLAVPVISRSGNLVGGLFFGHEDTAVFNEHHETLAAGIARWAGIALDNARLYNEAQRVQEQLRRANEAKDEFLGMVSHELRTPITTIYGGARLLQSRSDRLEQERKEDVLGDIEQEAERLYRLVEDLLALARMELGAASVEMRPVLLQRVAEKILAAFTKRRPNRTIDVRIPDDLHAILADATYVEQILRNLIGNADKYSPPDEPITLSAELIDGEAVVRVYDRGPGLGQEEIEAIFERFYRAEKTARQASGLGIGLTVCKRLVEVQGGRIWAESPGRGLIMSFTVPLADEPGPD